MAEVGISQDNQHVTLEAHTDYGGAPEYLSPQEARAVASALLAASFKAEMGSYAEGLTKP